MQSDYAIDHVDTRTFYLPVRINSLLANACDQKLSRAEVSLRNRVLRATASIEGLASARVGLKCIVCRVCICARDILNGSCDTRNVESERAME